MTGETISPKISAVPFMRPNQFALFSEVTGLTSAMTFPRRVIWMDRFVLRTCSTSAEQFALNCETGICFISVLILREPMAILRVSAPSAPDEQLAAKFRSATFRREGISSMRVLIAGGGTGGHVIPALAIARELKARYGAEVLFVGTARGMENRLVPQAGFNLALVKIGALKNVSMATRLRTLFDLPRAILHSRKIIREFRPDVVVGVGGYASGPAMAAAILGRVPTLAFEPNLVPGFANKMVGRRVSAGAVHFEDTKQYFRNARVVGVPVRPEFFNVRAASPHHLPTLLVFGGSQGAHAINQAAIEAIPEVQRHLPTLRVIHQTGERDYNQVQAAYSRAGVSAEVSAFIDNMPTAFAQA